MNNHLPETRVTLLDIARQLGVSNATVSLALSGHSRISASTRQKVTEMAEQLGYRPDPMLSALARHRSHRRSSISHSEIAWVSGPDSMGLSLGESDIARCNEAVASAAERSGYHLERYIIHSAIDFFRLSQILSKRGVRGILVAPLHEDESWQEFPWENYTVVRYGSEQLGIPGHRVCPDHVQNIKQIFSEIRRKGYGRIGYVAGAAALPGSELREAAYVMTQKRMDDSLWIPVFHQQADDDACHQRRFSEWLDNYRPEVIISEDPDLADILRNEGRDPNSLGIVYTSVSYGRERTGICLNAEAIGEIGFRLLDYQIKSGAKGAPDIAQNVLIAGTWVEGKTLPDRASLFRGRI